MVGTIGLELLVEDKAVTSLMTRLDSALSVTAISAFMTGVMVPYLHNEFERGFSTESAPDGTAWQPLSQATIFIRQNDGYGAGPINHRTGELEHYITNSPGQIMPSLNQAILRYPSNTVPSGKLGKKVRGAQKGEGKAPARPVLGLTPSDLAFLLKAFNSYVEKAVKI